MDILYLNQFFIEHISLNISPTETCGHNPVNLVKSLRQLSCIRNVIWALGSVVVKGV